MLPRKCCSLVIWRIPFQTAPNKKKTFLEKEWIRSSYPQSVREHSNEDLADGTKQTGRSNFQRTAGFTRVSSISDCELFTDDISIIFIKNTLKDAIASVEATGKTLDSEHWQHQKLRLYDWAHETRHSMTALWRRNSMGTWKGLMRWNDNRKTGI